MKLFFLCLLLLNLTSRSYSTLGNKIHSVESLQVLTKSATNEKLSPNVHGNIKSSKGIVKKKSYCIGRWVWGKNDKSHDFSLIIEQSGSNLVGTYCYMLNNGDKVDCVADSSISFSALVPTGTILTTVFLSSFSQTKDLATIKFDGKNLIWNITKEPEGEYYCPLSAKLLKQL